MYNDVLNLIIGCGAEGAAKISRKSFPQNFPKMVALQGPITKMVAGQPPIGRSDGGNSCFCGHPQKPLLKSAIVAFAVNR